jgi:hypothetical protein
LPLLRQRLSLPLGAAAGPKQASVSPVPISQLHLSQKSGLWQDFRLMAIRLHREAQTGDWITTIPIHYRDDFRSFASEIRLPCTLHKAGSKGLMIRMSSGLTRRDVQEHFDFFFDGIATVELQAPEKG